ncbi:hypothetical protein Taro_004638 [Colocasia esculenta]|uniref:Uncharacterized protein n=1 Tax=Colocasia esculenta TaxID=4460 RepID=A0A843TMM5_COLES|nr:hypothetical protein [Colocasia esculenta]
MSVWAKGCPYVIASAARDHPPGEEFWRRTGNIRMRPFADRVEVSILNWGLAGGSDRWANKYPHPTQWYDNRCTSTHAPWRNFGPETEFHETKALSTVSECRFRIVIT